MNPNTENITRELRRAEHAREQSRLAFYALILTLGLIAAVIFFLV
jgi:hypothetical protein